MISALRVVDAASCDLSPSLHFSSVLSIKLDSPTVGSSV